MPISNERLQAWIESGKGEGREMACELLERRKGDRWTPVSEDMPLTDCCALLWDGEGQLVGYLSADGEWETQCGRAENIIHWRPLPKPPGRGLHRAKCAIPSAMNTIAPGERPAKFWESE